MKSRSIFGAALAAAVLAAPLAAQMPESKEKPKDPGAQQPSDIVATAKASGQFTTFVKMVETAGMTETLQGAGPYTVFAPTDEAFAKLPPGTLDKLMNDKDKLKEIISYHMVPGKLKTGDLKGMADAGGNVKAKTSEGAELPIHLAGAQVHVGKEMANVVRADVPASNGVLYAIDRVVMPEDD